MLNYKFHTLNLLELINDQWFNNLLIDPNYLPKQPMGYDYSLHVWQVIQDRLPLPLICVKDHTVIDNGWVVKSILEAFKTDSEGLSYFPETDVFSKGLNGYPLYKFFSVDSFSEMVKNVPTDHENKLWELKQSIDNGYLMIATISESARISRIKELSKPQ